MKEYNTAELETLLKKYIITNYNCNVSSSTAQLVDLEICRLDANEYKYNSTEISIQQVPGLSRKIKKDLINNFGLKFKDSYIYYNRYCPNAYPYYTVYKIVDRNKLISSLQKFGLIECDVLETINTTKRKYYLPKYVCYDKAESRNRERNVFQTQLRINGKLYKNNLYTVKDALIYNVKNMLEHTDVWSLDKIADYIKTYDPEMENGEFIPSDTPKSPSVRKREKEKNIKQIKEAVNEKLKDLVKFAKDNDIDISVNIK